MLVTPLCYQTHKSDVKKLTSPFN